MSRCNQRTRLSMQKKPVAGSQLSVSRTGSCLSPYSDKHDHLAINRAPAISCSIHVLHGATRPGTSTPRMAHVNTASLCQGSATPFHRSQLATTESVIGSPCGLCTKLLPCMSRITSLAGFSVSPSSALKPSGSALPSVLPNKSLFSATVGKPIAAGYLVLPLWVGCFESGLNRS